MAKISASLVLYRSPIDQFENVISDFCDAAPSGALVVVDNSPEPLRSNWFKHPQVTYIHDGINYGFGKGHNRAMRQCLNSSKLHLIINPDVRFSKTTLSYLINCFEIDSDLVAAMPAVTYPTGEYQHLCKLLPTPSDLLIRRFLPLTRLKRRHDSKYELHGLSRLESTEVPSLSGCFLLIKSSALQVLKGFDERFFMYMEDVDLVRRLGSIGKVAFFPAVNIIHEYGRGSYRSLLLLKHHLFSAIKYFNKWGWIFDPERVDRNSTMLSRLSFVHDKVTGDADTI